MKGYLVLEDKTVYTGELFGKVDNDAIGEVVFNTSMTGYQEVLTDPSYSGQIVMMTYPMIGNYGVNKYDNQSDSIKASGFIVNNLSTVKNHWQSHQSIDEYLKQEGIIGIQGIDTRALTKKIRNESVMKGKIVSSLNLSELDKVQKELNDFSNVKAAYDVTTQKSYTIYGEKKDGKKIAVIDFGIKENILKNLQTEFKEIKVFGLGFDFQEIIDYQPDGLFLSNGPGDPKALVKVKEKLQKLLPLFPTFGICLGHQLIGLVYGLDTQKMKFGHRGANHPVVNKETNKVYITSQNHGYEVIGSSDAVEILYENVNDKTIEGLKVIGKPIFSVQFHPESSPGPNDSTFLFKEFSKLVEEVA